MYLIQDAITTICSNKAFKEFKLNSALQLVRFTSPKTMQVTKLLPVLCADGNHRRQLTRDVLEAHHHDKITSHTYCLIIFLQLPYYYKKLLKGFGDFTRILFSGDCIQSYYFLH